MKKVIPCAVVLISFIGHAKAQDSIPFICYSSTAIATNSSVVNPPVNRTGLMGECDKLPYIVPQGYVLVLTSFGIEGYPQLEGGVAIQPFIGTNLVNQNTLMTAQGGNFVGTKEVTGATYYIPTGAKLSVLLQSMQNCGRDWQDQIINCSPIFAWYLYGHLVKN